MSPADLEPHPGPVWAAFLPHPPGHFRWWGAERRYARRLAAAEDRFAEAIERHRAFEENRRERVARALRDQVEQQRRLDEATAEQHARIDTYQRAVENRDRAAVSKYFQKALDRVAEPLDFPRRRRVGYVPESTLLAVEWELPGVGVVPGEASYRYDRLQDAVVGVPRPSQEMRLLYQQLVAQLALRALHLVFGSDRYGVVDTVVFNGMVESVDLPTGQTVPPSAVRDLFGTVVDAGATKGILITTSGFGPSSYQFATGKPLQLIDGTALLSLCHLHNIPARIIPRRAS